jgi:asparagine synthase (glutamine-hydrolysing)
MCGILGAVTWRQAPPEEQVRSALGGLYHRGPDARSVEVLAAGDARCVLGHTRLRIIDLDPRADQPLPNEDGSVWLVYNGELYNHRELRSDLEHAGHSFRSNSDTEVIVHLYEQFRDSPAAMLGRLRGMFAFALFDQARGQFLLVRDRLGIKPMYWTRTPTTLAFASEIRSLARAGFASGEADPQAVTDYLQWGVVPGPGTMLAGVQELAPGGLLRWKAGEIELERWWTPGVGCCDDLLARDAVELVRTGLIDSVRRQLIADRPVGVFLSGGLDSRAIATLAAAEGDPLALTVTFPEAGGDEGEAASETARRIGARHELVPIAGADVARELPRLLTAMDQPTHDGVNIWVVCQAARAAGLVVALSGVGADELFGGYPSFRTVPGVLAARRLLEVVPERLRSLAAVTAGERNPGGRLARLLASPSGYPGAYAAIRGFFPGPVNEAVSEPPVAALGIAAPDLDNRDRVTLLELTRYLPYQLLRDTDQMSMSHSLEVRVPLLDDLLVRIALRLPPGHRAASGKSLLARAAGVESSPAKKPFALPFGRWIRGPLRPLVMEALLSEELPFGQSLPQAFRRRVWEAFDEGRTHWSRPWALTVLRLWPAANGFRWS